METEQITPVANESSLAGETSHVPSDDEDTRPASPARSVMSLQLQNNLTPLGSSSRVHTLSLSGAAFPGPDSPSRKRYHTAPRDKHRVR